MNVLIAGAGPTGLTLAIDLARRGIGVRLIEKAADYFNGSRGDGLQPRTLEVFDDLGVIDQVLEQGMPMPVMRISIGGKFVGERRMSRARRPHAGRAVPERLDARPVTHRGDPPCPARGVRRQDRAGHRTRRLHPDRRRR